MHLTFGRSVRKLLVNDDDKQGCAPMILASDCSGLRWVEIVDLECLPSSGTRNGSRLGCRFVVRILAVTRKGQRLDEARSARSHQSQQAHVFVRNTAPWHQPQSPTGPTPTRPFIYLSGVHKILFDLVRSLPNASDAIDVRKLWPPALGPTLDREDNERAIDVTVTTPTL